MSSLAKSAALVTISEIIFNLSAFIIHAVVGRILGPEEYGLYGLVITLTTMVIILIGNGIPTAMTKYISEVFESSPTMVRVIKRQAIILQTILIGSITLIFFLSAPLLAKILGDPKLTELFRFSTLIIPSFAAASFYFSYYTGLHRFGTQSFLKISRSIFKIICIIGLAYFFKLKGAIAGYIVSPALVFFLAYIIDKLTQKRKIETGEKIYFDWKKLANYAWQVIIFFLAYELLISIDLYLVKGILHDNYLTGIYNASLTVGRIPYYVFYALTIILLPAVSKSVAESNSERTKNLIGQSLRVMMLLLVPSIVLMHVFSEPTINLFYGEKFLDAAYPMSILVWGVGFLTIFYVLCFVMNGAGKTKIPMFISIFGVILNTVLNYVLIKKYGINGSAIATSIASFVVMIMMLHFLNRDFKILIPAKSFVKIIISGAAIYLISLFLPEGKFIFILWSVVLFAIYAIILFLLSEVSGKDLDQIKNMLKIRSGKFDRKE